MGSNEEDLNNRYWEIAIANCSECGASSLSLHPMGTAEPVECKCGRFSAYFADGFLVILHKSANTYWLRVSTGNSDNDDISTATIGVGITLIESANDLLSKLRNSC